MLNSRISSALKQKIYTFLCYVLLKIALDYACVTVFYSLGRDMQPNRPLNTQMISWLLYIIQVLFIIIFVEKRNDLLAVLFHLLFILNGVAFYSQYGLKTTTTLESFVTAALFWLIFTIAIGVMPKGKKHCQTPSANDGSFSIAQENINTSEIVLFIGCAVLALELSGVYGNFRMFIRFDDVYSYREDFANASVPTVIAYVIRWLSGVLLPYFFSRFLKCKKWLLAGMALLAGLFMYGIDGLKTTLIIFAVIIYFFVIFTAKKKIAVHEVYISMMVVLASGLVAGVLLFKATGKNLFNGQLYRVLVIPSQIADNYFLFIKDGEALLLRESIFRFFADPPYPKSINYMVSSADNVVANTGLFGDAYANFKWFGVITYPFLYSAILRKWQTICDDHVDMVSVSLGFIMIWNAINLSFFTWLLTGGVLIFFFLPKLMKVSTRFQR